MSARAASDERRATVIWHDVECGAYDADLPLWDELAEAAGGPLLELGCGTGRVALHLARCGARVTGIDSDAELVRELRERATREDPPVRAEHGGAAGFSLDQRFGLIIAPMQLIQLLPDHAARRECLAAAAEHLLPGALLALAIVEGSETGISPSPTLPDVRERDGWIYSSLPLGVGREGDDLVIERLRQAVAPDGHLSETRNAVRLQVLSASSLEEEGLAVGLRPAGRRLIEPSDMHVGSTVVLLEA